MSMKVITWIGEANRRTRITEPCDCASDRAITPDGTFAVLSGSEGQGNGFTVFLSYADLEELVRQADEVKALAELGDPGEDNEARGRML